MGLAVAPELAAETEILLLRIAYRPPAIARHQRFDRLALNERYVDIIALR